MPVVMVVVTVPAVVVTMIPGGSVSALPVPASILRVAVSRRVTAKTMIVIDLNSAPLNGTCIRVYTGWGATTVCGIVATADRLAMTTNRLTATIYRMTAVTSAAAATDRMTAAAASRMASPRMTAATSCWRTAGPMTGTPTTYRGTSPTSTWGMSPATSTWGTVASPCSGNSASTISTWGTAAASR
jgi:hypothetical protein